MAEHERQKLIFKMYTALMAADAGRHHSICLSKAVEAVDFYIVEEYSRKR